METLNQIIQTIGDLISTYVMPAWLQIICLIGTGIFLTIRLGLIQVRKLKHGIEVATGKYDNPDDPGDVSHFQALTTALSATVGVGNIAGVATAIHFGGPGALFWMWVTAFLGMAVKFSEVTLALEFRQVDKDAAHSWSGTVSGGPMHYIEKGLGKSWKPLALFFAAMLMITSFLTGNAIQANTLTDTLNQKFGLDPAIVGLLSVLFVGVIIFGGIKRIGKVTSVLAPVMALLYVAGALIILFLNAGEIPSAFITIFKEAFNPTSGIAGTGAGAFTLTMIWGVKRGLFSNEAGQGSAPIAHAAAQTDEPVSEGVVALLEPFIDTLIICTLTGLVLITTATWDKQHPTPFELNSGDITFTHFDETNNYVSADPLTQLKVVNGMPVYEGENAVKFAWHDVPVERMFIDEAQSTPFDGTINFDSKKATDSQGNTYDILYGPAVETGAPLTMLAFAKHLGNFGEYIVILCVVLFAVSTAISWSYYGDRCVKYMFGETAVIYYKAIYLIFHYIGAVAALNVIWNFGDVTLSIVIIPNLLALILLSGKLKGLTDSYFKREAWNKGAEKG